MWYIIAGCCILSAIVISIVFFLKINRKKVPHIKTGTDSSTKKIVPLHNTNQEIAIKVEMLPTEAIIDESKLIEITDSNVLAHINNLIPELAKITTNVVNVSKNIAQKKEVLYKAIIPVGAKLADSRATDGAVRGFYHGAKGISGHANFIATNAQNNALSIANAATAAMNLASMVVGQYYMSQINSKLNTISDDISAISNFQNSEYKSKVKSLIIQITAIAEFQVEILENNELRNSKISQINNLESECVQLLVQANLMLSDFANKSNLDFKKYEKSLKEAQNWFLHQNALLNILYKLAELKYTLYLGTVSRDQCVALISNYISEVKDTQNRLAHWHRTTMERLNIDVRKKRHKRVGFDRVIHLIPGLIENDANFRTIEENTANMIMTQISGFNDMIFQDRTNLYDEDVQLIAKNGKVYYLLKNED
ncbi:MAG: hypothetical protein J1F32_02250 [Erysipelotrichales bacterium]|nr:hypothetical protein [Erysipelotrichales bacterium]